MAVNSKNCWAKSAPFQSVFTHAVVSGKVAQLLLAEYVSAGTRKLLAETLSMDEEALLRFVGYLVSLHDIGKLDYSFQVQNEEFRQKLSAVPELQEIFISGVRHEKTGQMYLRSYWKKNTDERMAASLFSKIVGAHHQGKTGSGSNSHTSAWQSVRQDFESEMRSLFLQSHSCKLPSLPREAQGTVAAILLGLMILSDWISSGKAFSDAEEWMTDPGNWKRINKAAENFMKHSGLQPQKTSWPRSFCEIWKTIPPDGLRCLQRSVECLMNNSGNHSLLVLIEAPMGEGKTEAGIFAALQLARHWGKDGLYIALPTAATANQMVERAQALLNMHDLDSSIRLLHSMAWLTSFGDYRANSQDEQDEIASWLAPTKRGMLGQYAVGTVDQAMLAATNVKNGVLRLLGLSNKVLIIDEIHSYDAYMGEIIIRLLLWCKSLQIPVIMLSATLPPALKEKLLAPYTTRQLSEAYPLITTIDQHGTVTETEIQETSHKLDIAISLVPSLCNTAETAELAVHMVENGGCICVLMNTVKEAQEVYRAVKDRYSGDLLLFHAQFPAGQRALIEKECIFRYGKDKSHRPKQSILIATQVVEQSLDVDFDGMITAVAPIDLLFQRMGRVFRHDDTERPISFPEAGVSVLIPENDSYGASAYVYPECLLNSAVRILKSCSSINIPNDLAPLVKKGYSAEYAPEQEAVTWMEKLLLDEVEAGASHQYLLNPPDKLFSALEEFPVFEDEGETFNISVKTRLGEPSIRIALLSPEEYCCLTPFIKIKNGVKVASVWDRAVAENVMKQSVSVRISRLGSKLSEILDTIGGMLLSGLYIFQTENGLCHLNNGKVIRFDQEQGLLIE